MSLLGISIKDIFMFGKTKRQAREQAEHEVRLAVIRAKAEANMKESSPHCRASTYLVNDGLPCAIEDHLMAEWVELEWQNRQTFPIFVQNVILGEQEGAAFSGRTVSTEVFDELVFLSDLALAQFGGRTTNRSVNAWSDVNDSRYFHKQEV